MSTPGSRAWLQPDPLFNAVRAGDAAAVRRLLSQAAAPQQAANGWYRPRLTLTHPGSLLHVAAFHGHAAVCQALLEAGADPLAADDQGRLALHLAAERGDVQLLRLLCSHAGSGLAARNSAGETPWGVAARVGHPASVLGLLALPPPPQGQPAPQTAVAGIATQWRRPVPAEGLAACSQQQHAQQQQQQQPGLAASPSGEQDQLSTKPNSPAATCRSPPWPAQPSLPQGTPQAACRSPTQTLREPASPSAAWSEGSEGAQQSTQPLAQPSSSPPAKGAGGWSSERSWSEDAAPSAAPPSQVASQHVPGLPSCGMDRQWGASWPAAEKRHMGAPEAAAPNAKRVHASGHLGTAPATIPWLGGSGQQVKAKEDDAGPAAAPQPAMEGCTQQSGIALRSSQQPSLQGPSSYSSVLATRLHPPADSSRSEQDSGGSQPGPGPACAADAVRLGRQEPGPLKQSEDSSEVQQAKQGPTQDSVALGMSQLSVPAWLQPDSASDGELKPYVDSIAQAWREVKKHVRRTDAEGDMRLLDKEAVGVQLEEVRGSIASRQCIEVVTNSFVQQPAPYKYCRDCEWGGITSGADLDLLPLLQQLVSRRRGCKDIPRSFWQCLAGEVPYRIWEGLARIPGSDKFWRELQVAEEAGIDAGQFLTGYTGVVISVKDSEARRARYARRGISGQYDFVLQAQHVPRGALVNTERQGSCHLAGQGPRFELVPFRRTMVIDSALKGNSASRVNHSCVPNIRSVEVLVPWGPAVVLYYTLRQVLGGEKLCLNYNPDLTRENLHEYNGLIECKCGSGKRCIGMTIGFESQAA